MAHLRLVKWLQCARLTVAIVASFRGGVKRKGGLFLVTAEACAYDEARHFTPTRALDNARISLGGQDVSTLKVSLQQPLFTGLGVTHNYRRSNHLLDVSRGRLRTAQQTLAFEVVRADIAVLRAQKAAELSAQQVKALEAQVAQAQAFYDGG
jgi:outer membrane protein TolC